MRADSERDRVEEPLLGPLVPAHVGLAQGRRVALDGGERGAQLVVEEGQELPLHAAASGAATRPRRWPARSASRSSASRSDRAASSSRSIASLVSRPASAHQAVTTTGPPGAAIGHGEHVGRRRGGPGRAATRREHRTGGHAAVGLSAVASADSGAPTSVAQYADVVAAGVVHGDRVGPEPAAQRQQGDGQSPSLRPLRPGQGVEHPAQRLEHPVAPGGLGQQALALDGRGGVARVDRDQLEMVGLRAAHRVGVARRWCRARPPIRRSGTDQELRSRSQPAATRKRAHRGSRRTSSTTTTSPVAAAMPGGPPAAPTGSSASAPKRRGASPTAAERRSAGRRVAVDVGRRAGARTAGRRPAPRPWPTRSAAGWLPAPPRPAARPGCAGG